MARSHTVLDARVSTRTRPVCSESSIKSRQRVSDHGEVFTPGWLVQDMLNQVKGESERIDARFLEPACGSGNFLIPVLLRKLATVDARFASYESHKSHGAGIAREEARTKGVKVVDLESDQAIQDAVLSVHHATMHTFAQTGALKIIENHLGRAFIKIGKAVQLTMPVQFGPSGLAFSPGTEKQGSPNS
jgi:hypothetical protein